MGGAIVSGRVNWNIMNMIIIALGSENCYSRCSLMRIIYWGKKQQLIKNVFSVPQAKSGNWW